MQGLCILSNTYELDTVAEKSALVFGNFADGEPLQLIYKNRMNMRN